MNTQQNVVHKGLIFFFVENKCFSCGVVTFQLWIKINELHTDTSEGNKAFVKDSRLSPNYLSNDTQTTLPEKLVRFLKCDKNSNVWFSVWCYHVLSRKKNKDVFTDH